MTGMSEENARRLAARQEVVRPKITEAAVEEYRRIHYPESVARRSEFLAHGGVDIMGNDYIAKLSHAGFHGWFGTECDGTCPHGFVPKPLPWWKRLFGRTKLPRAQVRK